MLKEIYIRSKEYNGIVETIYFGGGTPSLLETEEIFKLIEMVFKNFKTSSYPEITLEANPDDLSELKLKELRTQKGFATSCLQIASAPQVNRVRNYSIFCQNLSLSLSY